MTDYQAIQNYLSEIYNSADASWYQRLQARQLSMALPQLLLTGRATDAIGGVGNEVLRELAKGPNAQTRVGAPVLTGTALMSLLPLLAL